MMMTKGNVPKGTAPSNDAVPAATSSDAAQRYIRRGLAVIPVRRGEKKANLRGWPKLRIAEGDVGRCFSRPSNVGVLNGEPSGNLIDVDLDWDEAVACAPVFLPPTECVFGRPSRPRSHYVYRVTGTLPKTEKLESPDEHEGDREKERNKRTIVEIRSTGSQTLFPPSLHPDDEVIRFDADGEPALVDGSDLRGRVIHVAICALLTRHWPRVPGNRHDIANAAGGFLLWHGVEVDAAVLMVETAARLAGDADSRERGSDVRYTAEKQAKGEATTGGPTLADLIGDNVVQQMSKWLGVTPRPGAGPRTGHAHSVKQSSRLIGLTESTELFHDPAGEPWATIRVGDHAETWAVRRQDFRRWLAREFYNATRTTPSDQAINEALGVLEGKAVYDGPTLPVFTRVAEHEGTLYLDLANDRWEVVEITPTGWRVCESPPVRFRRSNGMWPLPTPLPGSKLDQLRPFVNVSGETDWQLLVAWLLATFRPTGPFPVLVLQGEQGAAKSTLARVLRACIDPNKAPLRRPPRSERDLMIAASNSALLVLDNLSHLRQWLSDALCCLSTGGGLGTRQLHTDADEILFDATRPVILTGITEMVRSGDLLDRSLMLYLPAIPDERRRSERQFWSEFKQAHPRILGALLDVVAVAQRNLPSTHLDSSPRLPDFALWATAAEPGLGWPPGSFIASYTDNRDAANEIGLDASPLSGPVRLLVSNSDGGVEATATEILRKLTELAGDELTRKKAWPKDARSLSSKLRRLAPHLRADGIHVHLDRRTPGKGSRRLMAIKDAEVCDACDAPANSATHRPRAATQTGPPATQRATQNGYSTSDGDAGVDGDATLAELLDDSGEHGA